jgi:hypothetical protein
MEYNCLLGLISLESETCSRDYQYNDCDRAIYDAIDQQFNKIKFDSNYFNQIDRLPENVKAKYHFSIIEKKRK